MKSKIFVLAFILLLFLSSPAFPAVAPAASFQGLGVPTDGSLCYAYGVSEDGTVVAGQGYVAGSPAAFRWTAEDGITNIGSFEPESLYPYAYAYAISGDGSAIVGMSYAPSSGWHAFKWTQTDGMIGLGELPGAIYGSEARGVSADGSVIIGCNSSVGQAFKWTPATGMIGLDVPDNGWGNMAYGVSADGSVIVGAGYTGYETEACKWTQEDGWVGIGDLSGGSFYSVAYGISANDSVIVGYGTSGSGQEAFHWTATDGMIGLGCLPGGLYSYAYGVSADGSVIVGQSDSDSGYDAFYWTAADGMQSIKNILENNCGLDLTGWTLTEARAVSADGLTIVGSGRNPDGYEEAWIATIPEPSTIILLSLGFILLRKFK